MTIKKIQSLEADAMKHVAAYCRVSTQRDEQEESFETQKAIYTKFINDNPNWQLVKIYADRHSATSIKNRPGFISMMSDAESGKLDLILVKSISRFARNVVDCQQYIQRLSTFGCHVYFEKENLHTNDPTSSFILSLLSAVAQDESHSTSLNVRLSYESRFKRGQYNLGNNRILGYDCDDKGELIPNGDAWIIEEIYSQFLQGKTYREIADILAMKGAKTHRNKEKFSIATIRYILSNETYVGDKLLHKNPSNDYMTKRPDHACKYEPVYLRQDHKAIISRIMWEEVRQVLNHRKLASKCSFDIMQYMY